MPRTTIKSKVPVEGVGLHKGCSSTAVFLPAAGPTGIRFLKPDLASPVQASLENVSGTTRGTSISGGGRTIYTVEHILSACAGLGIDDLDVSLDSEEPPAMDGSALPFAQALMMAGLEEKDGQERFPLKLAGPAELRFGAAYYRAAVADRPYYKMTFQHRHKLVGTQIFEYSHSPENYLAQVAPARTFGFNFEIAQLRAAGLGLGGSLDNAIIIDDDSILTSEGGLRFPDEFVRHKLLDLLGDLKLTGLDLSSASVEAVFTGHKDNVNFATLLLERHAAAGGRDPGGQ